MFVEPLEGKNYVWQSLSSFSQAACLSVSIYSSICTCICGIHAHLSVYLILRLLSMYTDEEIMKVPTQMQVYIRRWRPSEYIFDPMKEVILDSASPDDLKKKVWLSIILTL